MTPTMGKHLARLLVSISLSTSLVFALPQPQPTSQSQTLLSDWFDPFNFSSITKIAAIGDSYSTGLGAGVPLNSLNAQSCRRYDHAYPVLVTQHPAFAYRLPPDFQFLSCSGALVKDVLDEQARKLDAGQDVIVVSAGGNDALLVDVLNQCVFQNFAPTKEAVREMAKSPVGSLIPDLMRYARTCEEMLDASEKAIESAGFKDELDALLDVAVSKLSENGQVYYTGYAKFWSGEMAEDDQCSGVSWSVFLSNAGRRDFQTPIKLTVAHRKRMNDLVAKMNKKIADAVKKHSDKATFVDYDQCFDDNKGRFCEPGVTEPDTKRSGLKFYELDISDPFGTIPLKRSDSDSTNIHPNTFDDAMNQLAHYALLAGSTIKHEPQPHGINAVGSSEITNIDAKLPNLHPPGYSRAFHPQIPGHQAIANVIVAKIAEHNARVYAIPINEHSTSDTCSLTNIARLKPTQYYCDLNQTSGLPFNVFSGMYDRFCAELPPYGDSWTVDSRGFKVNNTVHPGHGVVKRGMLTPPPNPSLYEGYRTTLQLARGENGLECTKNCSEAFAFLVDSPCGHTGAQQNVMALTGRVFDDCGTYEYRITPP